MKNINKNLRMIIICIVSIFSFSSCVSSPLIGIFVYSQQHVYGQNRGLGITSNNIEKKGESCSYSSMIGFLFLLYYGSGGSIEQAKEKGGITKVAVVDRSSLSIWPLYYEDCIVVWGE